MFYLSFFSLKFFYILGMTNQSQGIQQLLAAEKVAADKVGEARKRKLNSKSEKQQCQGVNEI